MLKHLILILSLAGFSGLAFAQTATEPAGEPALSSEGPTHAEETSSAPAREPAKKKSSKKKAAKKKSAKKKSAKKPQH